MEKILVSACLIEEPVRYDGQLKPCSSTILKKWQREGLILAFCPEVAGGLPVPRPPSEIIAGIDKKDKKNTRLIINSNGQDVTLFFNEGAKKSLEIVLIHDIKIAILKDGSPSCGSQYIYDGTFNGVRIPGRGLTAELLENNGINVFNENELKSAEILKYSLDAKSK
ncbi:MAG: DUF523 domain-containing protein [Desulfobacterales bacterium]|jgi:uncharacterized protein YbbK (DUF523 family)|nr:DUF523 domain-containing protein [Desulfobacteraceae bacterium]MBT4364481.1 DUF523 domain-containing protein [Desulfobacteraceae bacterium]MBT7084988.1 DUF523 domain-containing protein [Desulfobacterales bacterium]